MDQKPKSAKDQGQFLDDQAMKGLDHLSNLWLVSPKEKTLRHVGASNSHIHMHDHNQELVAQESTIASPQEAPTLSYHAPNSHGSQGSEQAHHMLKYVESSSKTTPKGNQSFHMPMQSFVIEHKGSHCVSLSNQPHERVLDTSKSLNTDASNSHRNTENTCISMQMPESEHSMDKSSASQNTNMPNHFTMSTESLTRHVDLKPSNPIEQTTNPIAVELTQTAAISQSQNFIKDAQMGIETHFFYRN